MSVQESVLTLGDDVAKVLAAQSIPPLVIGAVALAARGYQRATNDLDFAVCIDVHGLRALATAFTAAGMSVDLREPDGLDPLGGVLDITRADATVQIVSFDNPPHGGFPRLVTDALASATEVEGLPGLIAGTVDLILFKLYAGGPKSRNDILHLLEAVELDLEEVTARVGGVPALKKEWARILRDLDDELGA